LFALFISVATLNPAAFGFVYHVYLWFKILSCNISCLGGRGANSETRRSVIPVSICQARGVAGDCNRGASKIGVLEQRQLQSRRNSHRGYRVVGKADLVHVVVSNAQANRRAGERAVHKQSHTRFRHWPREGLDEICRHDTLCNNDLLRVKQLDQATVHAMLTTVSSVVIHDSSDVERLAKINHEPVTASLTAVKDGRIRANISIAIDGRLGV
jgi:hypothetical protein